MSSAVQYGTHVLDVSRLGEEGTFSISMKTRAVSTGLRAQLLFFFLRPTDVDRSIFNLRFPFHPRGGCSILFHPTEPWSPGVISRATSDASMHYSSV